MEIVTRFAPSPTGHLHIGGVRTALFNWLYAKSNNGKFKLRIEDTDLKRSTEDAKKTIINGLKWLNLNWDDEIVYQSKRLSRHTEIGIKLLESGHAYKCYSTPEELKAMREEAIKNKLPPKYNGCWRERDLQLAPSGVKPVIRIKSPIKGKTILKDLIQGTIEVSNSELDDFIIIRSDGTPTYMLSVVVDDYDMKISHIIRGHDHLTNTLRQQHIYNALGWNIPIHAHIPLIHGSDGSKLSKRHGALGIEAYNEQGFLVNTMLNYLLRLGWSHGDEEIISIENAIKWFNIESIGKSPAKFDIERLNSLNSHYINVMGDSEVIKIITDSYAKKGEIIQKDKLHILKNGIKGLKSRARTTVELTNMSSFYIEETPISLDEKSKKILTDQNCILIKEYVTYLELIKNWNEKSIEENIKSFCNDKKINLGKLAQPLRAALTGKSVSPGLYEVILALGKVETINRINVF
ncbi:MAG: Glutamate--tRNA ligase [Alphaproteobacteria bacterium MarineAlpha9_Bin1]|nr:MAG: Glutamate--tRNA ligase [Alphaproteobacteria bacterium MarineAlpha9_Bin1]